MSQFWGSVQNERPAISTRRILNTTMQRVLLLAACGGILLGQIAPVRPLSVAPGAEGDIVLRISSPRGGDVIDILTGNPAVRVSVLLPDNRVLTKNNADNLDFVWESASAQDLPEQYTGLDKWMLRGTGQHSIIFLPERLRGGDFRFRIDARGVAGVTEASARHISLRDYSMGALRMLPNVRISGSVQLPARSKEGRLEFVLSHAERAAGAEAPELDIVVTDPRVRVSLQYPDGTVVSRQTAETQGIDWQQVMGWPPTSVPGEDPYGLGVLIMTAMMLPIDGTHHVIRFSNGIPQDGVYRIHLDAADSKTHSKARAMFLPAETIAEMLR
jgi:hypothetical protein